MRYDYITIQNFFTKQESQLLIDKINNSDLKTNYVDTPAGYSRKTCTVDIVPIYEIYKETESWTNKCLELNQTYFGFDLFQRNLYDTCNLNVYDSSDQARYDFHIDTSNAQELNDIKLTAIANISTEPYEGGEFCIFHKGREQVIDEINEPGSIILFTSWIYHKVNPVTKGRRHSLSMFFTGPILR